VANSLLERTYNHFENITDPRANRGENHSLIEMIFVTLCATICGADSWTDVERYGKAKCDWLRQFIRLEFGVPSHDTFGRVFSKLDSVEFYAALQSWVADIAGSLKGETVAFDGKTLRGSFDSASGKSALHSVSAWACGLRLTLGLTSVDEKSNEIPAVQELINVLDLEGAVVTADAMHCQRETAKAVIEKKADYILVVKGNQPILENELNDAIFKAFDDDNPTMRRHRKREINRGREEYREVNVLPCPKNSSVFSSWEGIQAIGLIYRSREVNGVVEESSEAFITSLPCKVRDISKRIREHWGCESSQHHVLDVTFTEDASRIRKGTGPEISSVFRRLALSILQQDTTIKDSIRGKRKRCGWDNTALERLVARFQRH
jgi:predicted transposase YbfD/YdcC